MGNEYFEKDYYKTLGLDKSASADEIKKAYRKLARELHPDTNHGDKALEERFKEVTEAYDVLSDTAKKSAYDSAQAQKLRGGQSFGGQNFREYESNFDQDIFANIFEELFTNNVRNFDVEVESRLTFKESIEGKVLSFKLDKDSPEFSVNIPAGVEDGQVLKVQNKGHFDARRNRRGSLFIHLRVKKDKVYEVRNGHLYTCVPISVAESAMGGEIRLKNPYGESFTIRIPEGCESGRILRVKGKGVKRHEFSGDLFIEIRINYPKKHSKEVAKKYAEIITLEKFSENRDKLFNTGKSNE